MAKGKRVTRSKDDLKRELRDQLQLLRMACESFDRGTEAVGKHIAVSLRVLLHHHGQSRSLLDQLGYRTMRFYSSFPPLSPGNLVAETPLVAMTAVGNSVRYAPLIHTGAAPFAMRAISFSDWWAEKVIDDKQGHIFSRMTLVQNVANTDGGAHVDPDLDEAYMAVSRENSIGWVFSAGIETLDKRARSGQPLDGRIELACVRQIAHELLFTIHKNVPEFSDAAQPVVPHPPR